MFRNLLDLLHLVSLVDRLTHVGTTHTDEIVPVILTQVVPPLLMMLCHFKRSGNLPVSKKAFCRQQAI
jgi:hypothetical protein